jgi:hypothetical protein
MTKERRELATSVMKIITTGPEAMTLPEKPGWSCTMLDRNSNPGGRVYVVAYLGIEVALFFKRQLSEIIPEPGEKVPEGVMQDPKEAWQRLDLLGRSAEQSNFVILQQHRRLEEANKLLTSRAGDLDDLNDELTKKLEHKAVQLSASMEKITGLEKQIRVQQREIASLSKPTPKPKTSRIKPGKPSSVRVMGSW